MAGLVSIHMEQFQSVISELRTSGSSISSSMKTSRTLEKTNIEPFTKELELTVEAIELLEKYKALLDSDITILEDTGATMQENDERLGQVNANVTGPQPIR
ncbi:TIGR04197 family type VII secretion effector [Oceanobacillus caeni]|uniref:TIGR04197 family type VII secretion effector n=1 Tax=Oceanobacillus caeni TaxID=405946 RepID=UPI00214A87CE|nr:TIGR04197 family type VII secretion effector [Oceanobacillus caeni]MCR1836240.1 TIGR04197 family type VII secretion effector [Oceanobacillus caeni]